MISLVERALTFKPDSINHGALRDRPHERIRIGSSHGLDLDAAWLQKPSPLAALFIHGNRHNLTKFGDHYDLFDSLGISCLAFDFPGYGQSAGSPTEESLYRSASAAYSFLTEKLGYQRERIVIYGCSLGGAVALNLVQKSSAACLITESTFTNLQEIAAHLYPWLPVRLLLPNRFNNSMSIKQIAVPHFLIHGANDKVVPVHMAHSLFERANAPKELVIVPQASHTNTLVSGGAELRNQIAAFIEKATSV